MVRERKVPVSSLPYGASTPATLRSDEVTDGIGNLRWADDLLHSPASAPARVSYRFTMDGALRDSALLGFVS
jgi:hypothetical protein